MKQARINVILNLILHPATGITACCHILNLADQSKNIVWLSYLVVKGKTLLYGHPVLLSEGRHKKKL